MACRAAGVVRRAGEDPNVAAYLIADIEVIDSAGFEEYRARAPAVIAAHGGRYLARGGETEVLEGDWTPRRLVILQFPSMAALKNWWDSPEYRALRVIRERVARSRFVATESL